MTAPSASIPPPAPGPEIYEATRATDGSGAVDRGQQLTRAEAEVRRKAGLDIVVSGSDEGANWKLAKDIEAAISLPGQKPKAHGPHLGAQSLPHWQQSTGLPAGHSFYETEGTANAAPRKARTIP